MSVHNNNGSKMVHHSTCALSRVYTDTNVRQIVVGANSNRSVSIVVFAPELVFGASVVV